MSIRYATKVAIEAKGAILSLHPSEIDLNRNWKFQAAYATTPIRKHPNKLAYAKSWKKPV